MSLVGLETATFSTKSWRSTTLTEDELCFKIRIEKLYINKNSESIALPAQQIFKRHCSYTKIDQLELNLIKVKISKDYIE